MLWSYMLMVYLYMQVYENNMHATILLMYKYFSI